MKAKPFKQSPASTEVPRPTNDFVSEALAQQARLRPAKTPPKPMPITPVLPRVPKPHKRRKY